MKAKLKPLKVIEIGPNFEAGIGDLNNNGTDKDKFSRKLPSSFHQMNLKHQVKVNASSNNQIPKSLKKDSINKNKPEDEKTFPSHPQTLTVPPLKNFSKKKKKNIPFGNTTFEVDENNEEVSTPNRKTSESQVESNIKAKLRVSPIPNLKSSLIPLAESSFLLETEDDKLDSSRSTNSVVSLLNPLLTPLIDEDINVGKRPKSEEGKTRNNLMEENNENKNDPNVNTKPNIFDSNRLFGINVSTSHTNRAKLCIQTLTEGCIDAFEDLFNLSHREPVLVDELSETYFQFTDEKLRLIKELLVKADRYKRRGKFERVYDIYKQIADYFESVKDHKTMIYFYNLGEKIAKRSSNSELEGVAKENIGKVYERMGKSQLALKYHEAHMSLAHSCGNKEQEEKATNQLWRVYIKMAEESEEQGDINSACVFYEKSLKNAKQLQDKDMIALSTYRLGIVYKTLQDFERAIYNQEQYTTMCEELNDIKGKADAQCSLGELYEQRRDFPKAIETYQKFLTFAEEAEDDERISTACDKIGMLLNQLERYSDSVPYFEKRFEIAKKSKNDSKIGEAKVKLGFARGNANISNYMLSVKEKTNI
ncbi:hypothetical protein ABK040_010239 [Willaertia magna]